MHNKEKRKLIRKAVNFNRAARNMASCNAMYMGSLAMCQLHHLLGGNWPTSSLRDLLKCATSDQLDEAVHYCMPYLKPADKKIVMAHLTPNPALLSGGQRLDERS